MFLFKLKNKKSTLFESFTYIPSSYKQPKLREPLLKLYHKYRSLLSVLSANAKLFMSKSF